MNLKQPSSSSAKPNQKGKAKVNLPVTSLSLLSLIVIITFTEISRFSPSPKKSNECDFKISKSIVSQKTVNNR